MKLQFGTRALLYLTAATCIWIAGFNACDQIVDWFYPDVFSLGAKYWAICTLANSPIWLPLAVIAYALGARKFTGWTMAAFVSAELVGLAMLAAGYYFDP